MAIAGRLGYSYRRKRISLPILWGRWPQGRWGNSMNIIAGSARGRKLQTLPGEATRPTQAKVRGALFSSLMAYVEDASWLDLFAGSGAIGLEAASRGASRVVLVENATRAQAVIQENIALTKLPGVKLLGMNVNGAIKTLTGEKFDVVFMDPPYIEDPVPVVERIAEADLIVPDGRIVVEHRVDRQLPDRIGPYQRLRTSTYADAALSYYALATE